MCVLHCFLCSTVAASTFVKFNRAPIYRSIQTTTPVSFALSLTWSETYWCIAFGERYFKKISTITTDTAYDTYIGLVHLYLFGQTPWHFLYLSLKIDVTIQNHPPFHAYIEPLFHEFSSTVIILYRTAYNICFNNYNRILNPNSRTDCCIRVFWLQCMHVIEHYTHWDFLYCSKSHVNI